IKGYTVYGFSSTLLSEALTYFPIAYLTLRPILAAIDSNIEGMALSLGASRARVFRTVTLPLCIPGLANAFLLLFAASLADFATPLILAGNSFPVLPTQAYLQITGLFDLRGGAALSFVLLVPALIVFLLQRYWVSRRYYVTVTGKGAGQTPFVSVSPGARNALLLACALITLVIVYFYALLLYASVVVALGPTGIRATVALLQQIDRSLEEASHGLGAGSGTTFRRITLPLVLPAFFAGLGVVFIRSMTAISATIFLVSISWTLITVKILENI